MKERKWDATWDGTGRRREFGWRRGATQADADAKWKEMETADRRFMAYDETTGHMAWRQEWDGQQQAA